LHNAFSGQETTAAELFQKSATISSKLLELPGRYNSRSVTLHPHHETTPASATSVMPVALTKADYAGNRITQDEQLNASLDLSHNCSSLYVGSNDESQEPSEWGFSM
jgi:hypothetical protein